MRALNGFAFSLMLVVAFGFAFAGVAWADDAERLYEPEVNVAVAYQIWEADGGWFAWTCQP